jgi:hypothetical protein
MKDPEKKENNHHDDNQLAKQVRALAVPVSCAIR